MIGSHHQILTFTDEQLLANGGGDIADKLDEFSAEGWDIHSVVTTAAHEHVFILRWKAAAGSGGGR